MGLEEREDKISILVEDAFKKLAVGTVNDFLTEIGLEKIDEESLDQKYDLFFILKYAANENITLFEKKVKETRQKIDEIVTRLSNDVKEEKKAVVKEKSTVIPDGIPEDILEIIEQLAEDSGNPNFYQPYEIKQYLETQNAYDIPTAIHDEIVRKSKAGFYAKDSAKELKTKDIMFSINYQCQAYIKCEKMNADGKVPAAIW